MSAPTYSVLIPWANRPEICETLARNAPVFERHSVEIVIVNTGGDRDALLDTVRRAAVPGVRTVDLPGTSFNRSLGCNVGALAARGTYLFLLDADILVSSDIFGESTDVLREGRRFVSMRTIRESQPSPGSGMDGLDQSFLAEVITERTLVTRDGRRATLRTHKAGPTRVGDGLVIVSKADLCAVGGLNSQLVEWGYEDTDFQLRLQFQLGLERVDVGEVIHLTHATSQRSRESWQRNMAQCFRNYARGHYLGTLAQDSVTWGHTTTAA